MVHFKPRKNKRFCDSTLSVVANNVCSVVNETVGYDNCTFVFWAIPLELNTIAALLREWTGVVCG